MFSDSVVTLEGSREPTTMIVDGKPVRAPGSARIGRVLFLTACWRPLTIPSASAYLLLMATRNSISSPAAPSLKFSRTNALLAVAALAAISLGYFLLDQGSITAAPVLLVLGYVVLLPLAIIV